MNRLFIASFIVSYETINDFIAVAGPDARLEVPWLKTRLSLGQIAERILKNLRAFNGSAWTSATLAQHIFNHKPVTPNNGKKP